MKKIIIPIHSFIDVVTNSSTELFVCNTDKSLEEVESIIREKLEAFNKYQDTNYVFEKVFSKPYVYTQEMLDRHKKRKDENDWDWDGWGYEKQENVGNIIIDGVEDNSIPYDMWDKINELFNGTNYHLG